MKTFKIIVLFIAVGALTYASDKVYVKYLSFENPTGGMHSWTEKYMVKEHEKKCIYEYGAGVLQGYIRNTCTGKEHWFKVREDKPYAKPLKYKIRPMIDPLFYGKAYRFLIEEGNEKPADDTIVSSVNSKGVKIFCFSNMKACKTEQEVLHYINK